MIFKPRATKRTLIGAQLSTCKNLAATLYRVPCERVRGAWCDAIVTSLLQGYMANLDTQRALWTHLFGPEMLEVRALKRSHHITSHHIASPRIQLDGEGHRLLITEPVLNFPALRGTYVTHVMPCVMT